MYLDTGDFDWDEIAELVTDAYRLVAPKTLVKQVDRLGWTCEIRMAIS